MAKTKGDLAANILNAVKAGTRQYTKAVKAEERSPSSRGYRTSRMTAERGTSLKEAAAQVMEEAYMKASGGCHQRFEFHLKPAD
jgi:hypothetical protein